MASDNNNVQTQVNYILDLEKRGELKSPMDIYDFTDTHKELKEVISACVKHNITITSLKRHKLQLDTLRIHFIRAIPEYKPRSFNRQNANQY